MDVRKLQSFVKIVELRSFSDAAAALDITQSAISKQVKALEEELCVPLLVRSAATVEPTSAGKLIYERGKAMLDGWDRFLADCRTLSGAKVGTLKIGASTVPASYLLPRIVKRLREHYPHMELSVVESDSTSIVSMIEQREIDIAFVGASRNGSSVCYRPIAEDRLLIVGSPEMHDAPLAGLSLPEYAKLPFIIRNDGSGTLGALEEALTAEGFDINRLHVAAVASTTETSLALAEAGVGVTAVSKWALSLARNVTVLAEIRTNRCFYAAFEPARENDPVISLFLQAAAETYR